MSNKLITFCVPSYNSQDYLYHALDSLIPGGDEIEVLIIDDGSKDNTLAIAKDYEKRYPNIFKAVHQENKGHGGAINTAMSLATGTYFKVLDSDDWVKEDGLKALLDFLRSNQEADLILMPYTYRRSYDEKEEGRLIKYNFFVKPNQIVGWNGVKRFDASHNFTLHSVVYRLGTLKESGIVLPEHCFYEDNYLIYAPLPFVKKLVYLDTPLYQYLLGRDGQSMQTSNLIKRNENLMRVAELAFNTLDLKSIKKSNNRLYYLMRHQLVMMVTSPLLYTSFKEKSVSKKEKAGFISALKKDNPKQWRMLRFHPHVFWPAFNNWLGKLSSMFMLWVIRKFGAIN